MTTLSAAVSSSSSSPNTSATTATATPKPAPKRKRAPCSMEEMEQRVAKVHDLLASDVDDAMRCGAKRICALTEEVSSLASRCNALSDQLRAVQMALEAGDAKRHQVYESSDLLHIEEVTSNLANLPLEDLARILQYVVADSYFVYEKLFDLHKIRGRKSMLVPAFSLTLAQQRRRQLMLLRTVCHAFEAAIDRIYPFYWSVGQTSKNYLRMQNLSAMQWSGVRVVYIQLRRLTCALRSTVKDLLHSKTSALRKFLPSLAVVRFQCDQRSKIKLASLAPLCELPAPALIYHNSNSSAMSRILRPTNLLHLKVLGDCNWNADDNTRLQTLDVDIVKPDFWTPSSCVRPELTHLIMACTDGLCTAISSGAVKAQLPALTKLTYSLRVSERVVMNGRPLATLASDHLPELCVEHLHFRLSVDVHGLAHAIYLATKLDPSADANAVLTKFLASAPMVLLFPRASVFAAYDRSIGSRNFVKWLLFNGDAIHRLSTLRIVESPFMDHLGDHLPQADMAQFIGKTRSAAECAAEWLDSVLRYSPVFETTM